MRLFQHPVKCISYEPLVIASEKVLNFSIVFDQTIFSDQFKLQFSKQKREKNTFWHNIGSDDPGWWTFLRKNGVIATSFGCIPGGRGEDILKNYIVGDLVLAYVSGKGCVGYGTIEDLRYEIVNENSKDDVFPEKGHQRHRKSIKWIYTINIEQAIPATFFESEYHVPHPIQTSSRIKKGKVNDLINRIKEISENNDLTTAST